ncbi:MAG TPA: carboxypeptidase-like regulatory domain-containing protein [Acidimicrobiales bacterium]|nr:carboxypeptidase-like regulatory domain-containing protein [Acidimicrobiales bacterium]
MISSRARLVALLVAAVLVTAACTRGAVDELPAPPTTGPTTSSTARPDLSGVALAGVPGTTSTTVLLTPGEATLQGVVTGPDGPVPGATVLIERLVEEGVGGATIPTGPDGRWSAPAILGGRYRVRAWRAPDLALTTPHSFFLESKETRDLEVQVQPFSGVVVTSAMAPSPPVIDETVRLVVRSYTRSVDDQGIVRNQPLPSVQLELAGSSQWRVETVNPTFADDTGRGDWLVRCSSLGTHALSVRVGGGGTAFPLELAPCAASDAAPTAGQDGTTNETGSTSTTRRRASSSTTSG